MKLDMTHKRNPPGYDSRLVQKFLADTKGVSAAAWLLRSRRKSLHVWGAVDFVLPHGKQAPRWFTLAMLCLKRRALWGVQETLQPDGKRYRVRWMPHPTNKYRARYKHTITPSALN